MTTNVIHLEECDPERHPRWEKMPYGEALELSPDAKLCADTAYMSGDLFANETVWVARAGAEAAPTDVVLAVASSGFGTIKVDREEYEEAKTAGQVDNFLDPYLFNLEIDNRVFEPSGASYFPFVTPEGPEHFEPPAGTYGRTGRWLVRRTEDGCEPIGAMRDEILASYVATVLNQAASA